MDLIGGEAFSSTSDVSKNCGWKPLALVADSREVNRLDEELSSTRTRLPRPTQQPRRQRSHRGSGDEPPTLFAHRIAERPTERCWFIDELWGDEAVGIIGGEPKCCWSFLALDIAVSVASGAPCPRPFAPMQTGCVLLYAAEDALHVVRRRLTGIAAAIGRALADLDIHVRIREERR